MAKLPPELPRERRTVYNMLAATADFLGSAAALHQPQGDGAYKSWTWIEYREIAEEVAAGLRSLGIGLGDICGIASETRAEFFLADVGVMTNGSISAAVYTSLPPADQVKTLKAAEPKAIFVENLKMLAALEGAGLHEVPAQRILFMGEAEGAMTLDQLRQLGAQALIDDPRLLDRMRDEVTPETSAILYLTSGATGEPKMGLVTHNAILANCAMGAKAFPISSTDSTLVFLPSAHITQRLVLELLLIRHGTPAWFSESLSKMPAELRTVRPTLFIAPPRVWERMYASITTEIRRRPAAVRKLFYMGLGVGAAVSQARQQGRTPAAWQIASLKFFDKVVFSKIREKLGGRMLVPCSGSAPLGKSLADFYASIGLPLIEAYGLTEGGVVAMNPIEAPRFGSIGKPLPECELKTAEDGELLIRSETVFSGYYKDPGATGRGIARRLAAHRRHRRNRRGRLHLDHRPQEGDHRLLQRQEDLPFTHRRAVQDVPDHQPDPADRRPAALHDSAGQHQRAGGGARGRRLAVRQESRGTVARPGRQCRDQKDRQEGQRPAPTL